MRVRRILLLLALVAVFAGAGFATRRLLFERYGTEAQTPETPRFTPELERLLQEEKQKEAETEVYAGTAGRQLRQRASRARRGNPGSRGSLLCRRGTC
jgi:hypothetical protein